MCQSKNTCTATAGFRHSQEREHVYLQYVMTTMMIIITTFLIIFTITVVLIFQPRFNIFNLLAPELFFLILAHHVYKM